MHNTIENLALKIRTYYNSLDKSFVCEAEKIKFMEISLPDSINGVYYCQNGINIIAINKSLPGFKKEETFWHEFYHYCLSVGNYITSGFASTEGVHTKEEYRANLFVSLLLIDCVYKEDSICTIMDRNNVSDEIARIRMEYEYRKGLACQRPLWLFGTDSNTFKNQ